MNWIRWTYALLALAVTTVACRDVSDATETFAEGPSDVSSSVNGVDTTVTELGCPVIAVASNGATSGNARAPTPNFLYMRAHYLVTGAEMSELGPAVLSGMGWRYATNSNPSATGNLKIYLQNTTDVVNNKSSTWSTAITGMVLVRDAPATLPSGSTAFDVPFSSNSFTYTGGGLYVAYEFSWTGPVVGTGTNIACNVALSNGIKGAQSNSSLPTSLLVSNFRPETRFLTDYTNGSSSVLRTVRVPSVLPVDVGHGVEAVLKNLSREPVLDLPVTLQMPGAMTKSELVNIDGCSTKVVTFENSAACFAPGSVTATVSIPQALAVGPSSRSKTFTVSDQEYSYDNIGENLTGGVGFGGAAGSLVAKYRISSANQVRNVRLRFSNQSAGRTYRVVIFGDSGLGAPADVPLYRDNADRTASLLSETVTLPAPVAVGPGLFFVGVEQTSSNNIALGFLSERPTIGDTFYYRDGSSSWTQTADFRFAVGLLLDAPVALVASVNSSTIAGGSSATLSSTVNACYPVFAWTPGGATTSSITVSPANTTSYTVTVTDALNSRTTSATGTVTVVWPDTDGDGLTDNVDACPAENATGFDANSDGCIDDSDGDGLKDNVDVCSAENATGFDANGDGCIDDSDGDGVKDNVDLCPSENAAGFDADSDGCIDDRDGDGVVANDTCPNTAPGEVVNAQGCSIADLAPCIPSSGGGTWRSHGAYVSTVTLLATTFASQGLITPQQRAIIVSTAAKSSCGKK